MSIEMDTTKRPQTQQEYPPASSSTRTDVVAMGVAEENINNGATRPTPDVQYVTTTIWQSQNPQKTLNNEVKAPKLSKKMKHLQPFFES